VRVPVTGEGQTAFDAGAPAVPFAPPASILPRGQPGTFDERFPASAPPAGAPSAATRRLSPLSRQPMRYLPPSGVALPDDSAVRETVLNDWLAGLIRPRPRQGRFTADDRQDCKGPRPTREPLCPSRVTLSILKIPTAKVFEPLLQPARYKGAFGGRG